MYSLHLTCKPDEVDFLSGELWELGTAGIRELDGGNGTILIAGFEDNRLREKILHTFHAHAPEWLCESPTDWVRVTESAWPGRSVGTRLFLAPPWCEMPTPRGRERIVHNPGLACGTGEHPCTQLALFALERCVTRHCAVIDIGTGSGILAIAAWKLGTGFAVGLDVDEAALKAASENSALNHLDLNLIVGSSDCLEEKTADVTVANINASVLLSMADDLLRITRPAGWLILTGFPQTEAATVQQFFPDGELLEQEQWCCLISRIS